MPEPHQYRPGRLATAMGAAALAGQTVLVRELMVSFYGTETAIAATLCLWLAFVAAGALIGGWAVRRLGSPHSLCLFAVVWLAAALWPGWMAARLVRVILGTGVGAFVGPGGMLAGAALAAAPTATAVGFFFPCAAALAEESAEGGGLGLGRVYLLEAAGSAGAGALLSLVLLGRVGPAWILALASGGLLLVAAAAGGRGLRTALIGAATLVLMAGLGLGGRLEAITALGRWRTETTFERLASINTPYQYVELGSREGERVLVTNGRVSGQFPDRAASGDLAALLLTQHPAPERVLLVGGGLTGLCQALLESSIQRLDYVQPDPQAMAFELNALAEEDRAALQTQRFAAYSQDARTFMASLQGAAGDYDLVCINVGDPASAADSRFYTVEFLRQAAGRLRRGGVLAVPGITGSANYLAGGAALDYAACLYGTLHAVFPHVVLSPGEKLSFFASRSMAAVTTEPEVVADRFKRLGLEPALRGRALAATAFPADRVAETTTALAERARATPLNTDRRPILFSKFLSVEAAFAQGAQVTAVPVGGHRSGPAVLGVGLAVAALILLACIVARRLRHGGRAAGPFSAGGAVFTTGAFGLTAELLVIYGYQVTFGFVYRDVALLTGLFMLGLSSSAAIVTRFQPAGLRRALALAELGQAAFVLAVPWLAGAAWASPAIYALAATVTGALTGVVFPLAASLAVRSGVGPAAAAGWLSAADHGGAVLGAGTAGLVLLPALGLEATAILVALTKSASLLGLLIAERTPPAAEGGPPRP